MRRDCGVYSLVDAHNPRVQRETVRQAYTLVQDSFKVELRGNGVERLGHLEERPIVKFQLSPASGTSDVSFCGWVADVGSFNRADTSDVAAIRVCPERVSAPEDAAVRVLNTDPQDEARLFDMVGERTSRWEKFERGVLARSCDLFMTQHGMILCLDDDHVRLKVRGWVCAAEAQPNATSRLHRRGSQHKDCDNFTTDKRKGWGATSDLLSEAVTGFIIAST